MCGILVCSLEIAPSAREAAFASINHRGPDASRSEVVGSYWFGFHRLAIMGVTPSGMQPFHRNGHVCVCNGELYGFETLKTGLAASGVSFTSESDCEILLPLYERYGTAMFALLDAEFALVLYDPKQQCLIAARDPLGIRPLFYGKSRVDGSFCFCSEAKGLVPICDEIVPFPVGSYFDGSEFHSYHQIEDVRAFHYDDLDKIAQTINKRLRKAVYKRMEADVSIGFLLSGGLDSSLVCAIAAKQSNQPIKTYAIGMERDAMDLGYARQVASYLKSEHTEIIITPQDVLKCVRKVIATLESYDITTIRASIGMYLLCEKIKEQGEVKVLLSGEVSDELFGYAYTDYAPSALAFQKESEKRVKELYLYDGLRADRCMSAHGLEARVPFGDLSFVSYVLRILPDQKMNSYAMGKYLLRRAFVGWLPDSILYRQKSAFSDGVGHSLVDVLQAHAENRYDDTWQQMANTYCGVIPISKEALWYREVFEELYPKQAHWIPAYWMPNTSWQGCDVNDPSARYLDNYQPTGLKEKQG